MDDPQARPHGGDGRFVGSLTTAQRDAEAARFRTQGWTYQRIADYLGFKQRADAYNAVKRVLDATVREAGDDVRALELGRLDAELARLADVEREVWTVLKRKHVTVSNGQIIRLEGEPLLDDAPVLQAADRLVRIEDARRKNGERRARLLGLDAPTKQNITITPERAAALEQLVEELGEQ